MVRSFHFLKHAAAKSLQSCPTLCDPIDGSPPALPSLGFSRQEHWSGLPLPSPLCESEVAQSCPTLSDPMDCSLPVHGIFHASPWDFPGKSTGVGCHCLLRQLWLARVKFPWGSANLVLCPSWGPGNRRGWRVSRRERSGGDWLHTPDTNVK